MSIIQRAYSTTPNREQWQAVFIVIEGKAAGTLLYCGKHVKEFSVLIRTVEGCFDVGVGSSGTKMRFQAELPKKEEPNVRATNEGRTKRRVKAPVEGGSAVRDQRDRTKRGP